MGDRKLVELTPAELGWPARRAQRGAVERDGKPATEHERGDVREDDQSRDQLRVAVELRPWFQELNQRGGRAHEERSGGCGYLFRNLMSNPLVTEIPMDDS